MLTLHRLPRAYRLLYVGIAGLLAAALLSHWWRLGLRHGVTPAAVVAWYRGDETAMLFRKSAIEVADDAWSNLFHHTLAFLVLGGLLVRSSARPVRKAALGAAFAAATLVSAAGPALVWWGVPGAGMLYVAALATLSGAGLTVAWLVVRDGVLRGESGERGVPGSDVLTVGRTVAVLVVLAAQPPDRLFAQHLLSERQAIAKVFPGARYVATDSLRLDSAARTTLERTLGRPLYEPVYPIRLVYGDGAGESPPLLGFTLVTEERGKYRPITMLVGVDSAHRVAGVQILVYREPRGGEVARQYFLRQYRGKTIGSPIRLNRDVINISGATISVQSVNAGVRKTLALVHRYFPEGAPLAAPRSLLPLEEVP